MLLHPRKIDYLVTLERGILIPRTLIRSQHSCVLGPNASASCSGVWLLEQLYTFVNFSSALSSETTTTMGAQSGSSFTSERWVEVWKCNLPITVLSLFLIYYVQLMFYVMLFFRGPDDRTGQVKASALKLMVQNLRTQEFQLHVLYVQIVAYSQVESEQILSLQ